MPNNPFPFSGLTEEAVISSRRKFGINEIRPGKNRVWKSLQSVAGEPMFIILMVAAAIYYSLGEIPESLFMLTAILLVSAISFYQDYRSNNAMAALRALASAKAKVIRNNRVIEIPYPNVVVGDFLIAEEGTLIAADGKIVQCNDFAVNESILTGEAFPVFKDPETENQVIKGTLVVSGLAVYEVKSVGQDTQLGKIGRSLKEIKEEKSPLQQQIEYFVKQMAFAGGFVFLLIWVVNFFRSQQILDSLLKALTLAMSILPEEIPVAFTTFMALGAWRLMQKGIIVKEIKTVETLGAATIICVDKTGTITENRMELVYLYVPGMENTLSSSDWGNHEGAIHLIEYAMWASEPVPFDPMEKALHEAYLKLGKTDERPAYKMVHEYPLSGKPPMMTHIFENVSGKRIIATKGAPEAILRLVTFTQNETIQVWKALESLLKEGYRVLAVASSAFQGNQFPEQQQKLPFMFRGFVAFYDPPKPHIKNVFKQFYDAGISIKIITGDNPLTTSTIARQAGLRGRNHTIDGDKLLNMSDTELKEQVKNTQVFTRMFPEAKLRIINALKEIGNIVAMTGDGVNDGPALKAAHIGIAMGKRGSEIARQSSALILTDDDLGKMADAIALGRKIYSNLKKAIQYIISIHIPIILTVALPLLLNWIYPNIFTPVHVIFLELIMGPTCSIVYENEPMEANSMRIPPRLATKAFLSLKELSLSIWQGLIISAGALFIYQYAVQERYTENIVRTMVFTTLVAANIFLTYTNRSFYYSMFSTLKYRNWLLQAIIIVSIVLLYLLITIPVLRNFFQFAMLNTKQLFFSVLTGCISVIWFEVYKFYKRRQKN